MGDYNKVKNILERLDPDSYGETFYIVDSNFRTVAQGWSNPEGTGPLDLYNERNTGHVVYCPGPSSSAQGTDSAAIQFAVDAMTDYRGDKLFFTPGSYAPATAIALNCHGMRVLGPSFRNLKGSRVVVTDGIGSAFTITATDIEIGNMTLVPLTATTMLAVGNGANFGYLHDLYYNALGITGSTSTVFCTAVATTIDWMVERCSFNVDAAQGPAFLLDSPTRWLVQDSDFYVNITAIAWASVFTFTTTALGNVVRRCMFRGCGGATPAVFTHIFTGIANVNGQLMAYLNFVDGTAMSTGTDIEVTFGTTTDIELAENYLTGDATTEGGVIIKLA